MSLQKAGDLQDAPNSDAEIGFARALLRLVRGGIDEESARVLATLNWDEQADYLSACGLARAVYEACQESESAFVMPQSALQTLKQRALYDAMQRAAHVHLLTRIAEAARVLAMRVVLLKGAALLAWETTRGWHGRASADIDVWVPPARAAQLQEYLLQNGFNLGEESQIGPSHHHLPELFFCGARLEIHTALADADWKLPAALMLENTLPLPGDFRGLETLGAEAFILHTAYHNASHGFALGMRAAWDMTRIQQITPPDWTLLLEMANRAAPARLFWAIIATLQRDMEIGVPDEFLAHCPGDRRQNVIEHFAAQSLLAAVVPRATIASRFTTRFLCSDSNVEKTLLIADRAFFKIKRGQRPRLNPLVILYRLKRAAKSP